MFMFSIYRVALQLRMFNMYSCLGLEVCHGKATYSCTALCHGKTTYSCTAQYSATWARLDIHVCLRNVVISVPSLQIVSLWRDFNVSRQVDSRKFRIIVWFTTSQQLSNIGTGPVEVRRDWLVLHINQYYFIRMGGHLAVAEVESRSRTIIEAGIETFATRGVHAEVFLSQWGECTESILCHLIC